MIAFPIAWAGSLFSATDAESLLTASVEAFGSAFPGGERLAEGLARAVSRAGALMARLPDLGEGRARLLKAGMIASLLHGEAALPLLPISALLVLAGVFSGLALRERLRDQAGYASPTAAALGRMAVGAGVFWALLYTGSPLPVSPAWLYASSVLTSLGGTLYAANLPLRL